VAVFFSLANYRQISTFFKGQPPVKWKKRGVEGVGRPKNHSNLLENTQWQNAFGEKAWL
jgi:hypothetical protein